MVWSPQLGQYIWETSHTSHSPFILLKSLLQSLNKYPFKNLVALKKIVPSSYVLIKLPLCLPVSNEAVSPLPVDSGLSVLVKAATGTDQVP